MFRIEKVNENNKQCVIDFLRLDVIRHVFALYDILHEPEHTTMYTIFEGEQLKGYILIYTAMEFPSVVLECEGDIAERLIKYAPKNRCIIHVSPSLLPIVTRKFSDEKHYVENWMLVKRGEADFFRSKLVRRLCADDDASNLAILLSSQRDRPKRSVKKYIDLISNESIYGVFVNGKLVSYAGSFIQLPQVWMIGGVYTDPRHRRKGYATLATSVVTEEALKHAETAALFVRSDNCSAIKVYEKIGYRKIGEKLWVDIGTGMKP